MTTLAKLFREGTIVSFKKGDILISPKKKPKGIYRITQGFIYSYSKSFGNKKRIQMILKKGDVFPLAWAVNNTQKDVYVEALTDTTTEHVTKDIFLTHVKNNQNATWEMISILISYLSVYVDRVDNLEFDTVREKVLNRILFFTERFGKKKAATSEVDLPITHKLIAESISVSRENVTRELKLLEKKRVIAFKNHQLIVNSKELEEELRTLRETNKQE